MKSGQYVRKNVRIRHSAQITMDEWQQAITETSRQRIDTVPKDCITLDQFAKRVGLSASHATKKMRELVASGAAEVAGKFRIQAGERILGVQHYRLKKK